MNLTTLPFPLEALIPYLHYLDLIPLSRTCKTLNALFSPLIFSTVRNCQIKWRNLQLVHWDHLKLLQRIVGKKYTVVLFTTVQGGSSLGVLGGDAMSESERLKLCDDFCKELHGSAVEVYKEVAWSRVYIRLAIKKPDQKLYQYKHCIYFAPDCRKTVFKEIRGMYFGLDYVAINYQTRIASYHSSLMP